GFDNIPTTSLPRLSATSKPVRSPLQRRVPLARRARRARRAEGGGRWAPTSERGRSPLQRRVPLARRALGARGMNEAVTWSFLARAKAERFGAQQQADLRLLNLIDATPHTLRPSILPNLIDAAQRNEARGLADPALFEVGPEYKNATPTGQRTVAAGLRSNMAVPRNWQEPARAVDAFDAKADALAVLAAIGTVSAESQSEV